MKKWIILLSMLLLLTACSNEVFNDKHEQYLAQYGLSIKSFIEEELFTFSSDDFMFYDNHNFDFLKPYIGQQLVVTRYQLNDRDIEGDTIQAFLYEYNGGIIGAVGKTLNATPGVFQLDQFH